MHLKEKKQHSNKLLLELILEMHLCMMHSPLYMGMIKSDVSAFASEQPCEKFYQANFVCIYESVVVTLGNRRAVLLTFRSHSIYNNGCIVKPLGLCVLVTRFVPP
jgi:hypothetical protein